MSQRAVKWGQAKKYFQSHGYTIDDDGGDKLIKAPKGTIPDGPQSRLIVRIGHKYSNHNGDELTSAHISKIKRSFKVTRKQLLDA